MFRTKDELRKSLRTHGFGERDIDLIVQRARPRYHFVERSGSDELSAEPYRVPASVERNSPLGTTKFGGSPDLPRHIPWPIRPPVLADERLDEDESEEFGKSKRAADLRQQQLRERASLDSSFPLTFLFQLDLKSIDSSKLSFDLPNTGRLLLFRDARPQLCEVYHLIYDNSPPSLLERRPMPDVSHLPGHEDEDWFFFYVLPATLCEPKLGMSPPLDDNGCPDSYGDWWFSSDNLAWCTSGVGGPGDNDDPGMIMILELHSNEDHCVSYAIDMTLRVYMTAGDLKARRFDRAVFESHTA